MMRALTREGAILGYRPEQSRLLVRLVQALARGRPITAPEVDGLGDELGMTAAAAHAWLPPITERDPEDRIIGLLGLSLGDHRHRFWVNGQRLTTWCAEDTLFLPALLGRIATVESTSPLSREPVRLTVGPNGVQAVTPAGTVVSIPLMDPDDATFDTVEAIWRTFCRQIHFFASREEAAEWAAGRADLAILTLAEAYRLGRLLVSRLLDQAP
jgi:alkylmercury lyase